MTLPSALIVKQQKGVTAWPIFMQNHYGGASAVLAKLSSSLPPGISVSTSTSPETTWHETNLTKFFWLQSPQQLHSANQNITNNVLHEKPEEDLPSMSGPQAKAKKYFKISSYLASWCFEPSPPQRITSGLNTNFTLSPSYSFHKSSYHKSCFFSLFIFRGHSTQEPVSSRVTYFILWAYTGTMC